MSCRRIHILFNLSERLDDFVHLIVLPGLHEYKCS